MRKGGLKSYVREWQWKYNILRYKKRLFSPAGVIFCRTDAYIRFGHIFMLRFYVLLDVYNQVEETDALYTILESYDCISKIIFYLTCTNEPFIDDNIPFQPMNYSKDMRLNFPNDPAMSVRSA